MSDYLVEAVGLTKKYGNFTALNGIDLHLDSGKIIGILGPNGSGKTTLIKLLSGLLTKTEGTLTVCGLPIGYETKSLVSYLPERPYFPSWKRVDECLGYFEDFYRDFDRPLAEKMLLDLNIPLDKKLKTLSKGTKEKVQLVLVMARRSKLYLLDEPIAGVDPAAREYIIETVLKAYHPEATVLISTHLIDDVEGILDEFVLLNGGNVVMTGTPKAVKEQYGLTLNRYFREVFRCL